MKFDKDSLLLYAVTDRHWLKGRSLKEDVESALKGGASFIQLREKEDMALDHDAYLQEALEIGRLCRSYGVPFVLDDEVELAIEADAVFMWGRKTWKRGWFEKNWEKRKSWGYRYRPWRKLFLQGKEGRTIWAWGQCSLQAPKKMRWM